MMIKTIWEDPIVQEVHDTRQKIWQKCGQNWDRLIAFYRELESEHPERLANENDVERLRIQDALDHPSSAHYEPGEGDWEDPIVKEVHAIRQQIWRECGGDRKILAARRKAAAADHHGRVVTLEDLERMRQEPTPQRSGSAARLTPAKKSKPKKSAATHPDKKKSTK